MKGYYNMEPKNPIVIDSVDVSGCIYYQYSMCTATKDNCGDCSFYCKDYDMNDCYYKQLKRKEKENERYEQALIVIEDIAKADFNHTCWETYAEQLKQIIQEVGKVLDE